jgi:hypothetical protein
MPDIVDDLIQQEAGRKVGEEGGSGTTDAGGVIPNAEAGNQNQQSSNQPAAQQQNAAEQSTEGATTQSQPDYDKIFNEISGGYFQKKDDFVNSLPKVKEYDSLKQKYDLLEASSKVSPFADEEMKMLNDLKKSGASKEQLQNFARVNELGDLAALDPKEAKIMKLVLVDGWKESAAKRMVNEEFDLDNLEDEDLEFAQEKLRMSAKSDIEALSKFKVSVSSVSSDDSKIHDAAKVRQIETALTPVLTDFKEKFNSLAELNLKSKNNTETFKYNVSIPAEYKDQLTGDIRRFFVENQLPVTQENWNQALEYARSNYLEKNLPAIAQDMYTSIYNDLEEKIRSQYENTGGLPKGDSRHAVTGEAAYRAFQEKVANGTV